MAFSTCSPFNPPDPFFPCRTLGEHGIRAGSHAFPIPLNRLTEKFDCGTVNHGKYSVFPPYTFEDYDENGQVHAHGLHVPVALIGIAGYVLIGLCALLGRMWIVFELAQVGFFCAAFLSFIEAYVIQKWCIYCLWSQSIMTTILVLSGVALLLQWRRQRASAATPAGHVG